MKTSCSNTSVFVPVLLAGVLGCSAGSGDGPTASSSLPITGGPTVVPAGCLVSLGALTIGASSTIQAGVAAASVTAGARTTLGGDVYASGNVVLGAQSSIAGALDYGGTLTEGAGDSVGVTLHANVAKPTIPVLAPAPGTTAITVPANGTRTLTPGAYGTVTVGAGARVTFAAGTFDLASLTVGSGATVTFDTASGGVLVEVKGAVSWANGTVQAADPTHVTLYSGASVTLGAGLAFAGSIVAPAGAVSLGANSSVPNGCVQGGTVTLGSGVGIAGSANPCLALADGAACDDGNACTRQDTCQSGVCVGSQPVVCAATDACHLAGTCDETAGTCGGGLAPAGTQCGPGLVCDGQGTCGSATRSCEKVGLSDVVAAPGNDETLGVAVDAQGAVYLVGETAGLEGVTISGVMGAVLKFDAAGNRLWTQQFGSSGDDTAAAVATVGNVVYVAGVTGGSLDGTPSAGGLDAFLAEYDGSGNLLWRRQFGSAGDDRPWSLAVDAAGNAYVAGTTNGSLDGASASGWDSLFVVQFDTNGNRGFTRELGTGVSHIEARSLAADAAGNLYVTGYTSGGDFEGQPGLGQSDYFLVKLDATGAVEWSVLDGSAQGDFAHGVATDPAGNAYVVGFTTEALDGSGITNGGEFFLAKYDANGNRIWARERGPQTGIAEGLAVAVDHEGDVVVTGAVSGSLDGNAYAADGFDDWFLARYTTDGTWISSDQSGLPSADDGLALAADPNADRLYLGAVSPQPEVDNHISYDFMLDQLSPGVCPALPPPPPKGPPPAL
ncbi:MAG TPA: SBBP repeat-containing protein [Polyangiaceae bacterium]|nr:SBBP repeat-containing protein [Polyangiaceae bacterium]